MKISVIRDFFEFLNCFKIIYVSWNFWVLLNFFKYFDIFDFFIYEIFWSFRIILISSRFFGSFWNPLILKYLQIFKIFYVFGIYLNYRNFSKYSIFFIYSEISSNIFDILELYCKFQNLLKFSNISESFYFLILFEICDISWNLRISNFLIYSTFSEFLCNFQYFLKFLGFIEFIEIFWYIRFLFSTFFEVLELSWKVRDFLEFWIVLKFSMFLEFI